MSSSLKYGIIYQLGMEIEREIKWFLSGLTLLYRSSFAAGLIGLYIWLDQTVASYSVWDFNVLKQDTEISTDAECLQLSTDTPDCFYQSLPIKIQKHLHFDLFRILFGVLNNISLKSD